MKPLSDTYKKLGIDFTFPIEINDAEGNQTYYEDSDGYWYKHEYDAKGNQTYREISNGFKEGTPRSQSYERKVIEDIEQRYARIILSSLQLFKKV